MGQIIGAYKDGYIDLRQALGLSFYLASFELGLKNKNSN